MPGRNAFLVSNDTAAHDIPLAEPHKRQRQWEKDNPARRYLIPTTVRDQVSKLASELMENVDPLACLLFDYAELHYRRGKLTLQPRLNPKGRKHQLVWSEGYGVPHQRSEPDKRSQKGKTESTLSCGENTAYRLGEVRHQRLRSIAEEHDLRLADVLAAFLLYSLDAYNTGQMIIRREPAVVQMQVKGWSE